MIELMLRDPVQHVIEVIPLPRHAVAQPRIGQLGGSLDERLVMAKNQFSRALLLELKPA